jgi:membrane fusion protein, epimerase transport system
MSSNAMTVPLPGASDDLLSGHAAEAKAIVRKVSWIFALAIVPAAAWLTFAPMTAAVVTSGYVKVDNNRRTLQHAEGGIVRVVHVRDGQKVKAGDVLIEMGDVAVAADRERLYHRLLSERAGVLRLEAEQSRAAVLVWPAELSTATKTDPALAEQLRKEEALFAARRNGLEGQSALLRDQKQKVEQELALLDAQFGKASEALDAQRVELDTNAKLVAEGFVPNTRLMQLQSSVSDYAAKLEERRGDRVRAQQRMVDLDIRLKGLENEYRQQASDQLKVALPRVQEIEQELRKAADASTRQAITAPVDGEVMGLKVTHNGTVVAPREPLVDVVPVNPKLVVEARIRTEDVNRVLAGQHADVRFTAYKTRSTSLVSGEVSYLAADRQLDPQTGQPYYTVHIAVDANSAKQASHGQPMHAGMPAEVYIEGEKRTPLQYLVDPVTQVLRLAGRER